ncbi:hypothetical protein ACK6WK_22135 [Citrobacter portucalensis]|uniref:hypothetical protein n=1 Tax=Citrobacter portucalensis TaxID=1639133 RepID=UPI003C2BFEF3
MSRKLVVAVTVGFQFLLPSVVDALTFQWAVPTDVSVITIGGRQKVKLTFARITVDDPSIGENESTKDVLSRKVGDPWIGSARYVWGHFIRTKGNNGEQSSVGMGYEVEASAYKMFTDFARAVASKDSLVASPREGAGDFDNLCVGSAAFDLNNTSGGFENFISSAWNAGMDLSPNNCLTVPPADQWCALTEPSLTLDFGTAQLSDASKLRAKAITKVECTTGMMYTIQLRGTDAIPLSNGMRAFLTANSKPLGTPQNGEKGPNNQLVLEASLSGQGSGGALKGSGVIFVNYP